MFVQISAVIEGIVVTAIIGAVMAVVGTVVVDVVDGVEKRAFDAGDTTLCADAGKKTMLALYLELNEEELELGEL